jgi:hypothetical protein
MSRIIALFLMVCTLGIAGCGGGNDGAGGLNGAVTVTGSQVATDSSSNVTFTIQYTHPLKTDLIGVPINYTVTVDGDIIDHVATNFNNSGILSVTYSVPKVNFERSVHCVANSANLIGSATQKVAALGTLEITPLSATFADSEGIGTTKTFTVSGGAKPYSFVVTQSVPGLVTAVPGASGIVLTRASDAAGTVLIEVTDNLGTKVSAQATLVAVVIPPPA